MFYASDWTYVRLRTMKDEVDDKDTRFDRFLNWILDYWGQGAEDRGVRMLQESRDYMIYLLMMQPILMSAIVGIGRIRFRDTYEEAKRFFDTRHITQLLMSSKEASFAILFVVVPAKAEPIDVKGDRSKSVLFDGAMLAKEHKSLNKNGDDTEM
ncbi:unnamed protein product [Arabidopsis halleri]